MEVISDPPILNSDPPILVTEARKLGTIWGQTGGRGGAAGGGERFAYHAENPLTGPGTHVHHGDRTTWGWASLSGEG